MPDDQHRLRLLADNLLGELAELERQINDEGGFLTSDPRVLRMRSLREEYDAVEDQLFECELNV